jgi:transcriptional regulator with XRE-family HTH domain
MQLLHDERARQGLSLADMQARTGIARSALSRLETDSDANPTLTTVTRYAEALGKDVRILLADRARRA